MDTISFFWCKLSVVRKFFHGKNLLTQKKHYMIEPLKNLEYFKSGSPKEKEIVSEVIN